MPQCGNCGSWNCSCSQSKQRQEWIATEVDNHLVKAKAALKEHLATVHDDPRYAARVLAGAVSNIISHLEVQAKKGK